MAVTWTSFWTSKQVSGPKLTLLTQCCTCGHVLLFFPLEKCVWMWISATWRRSCPCTLLAEERRKAEIYSQDLREQEVKRRKGKRVVFLPLEQSSPRQPPSHWQRSGAMQRPWTHSLVQWAVGDKRDVVSLQNRIAHILYVHVHVGSHVYTYISYV